MFGREIQLIAAPSILGLKPTGVDKLPGALLAQHLQEKLHAENELIVVPTLNHCYSKGRDPVTQIINTETQEIFLSSLQRIVESRMDPSQFLLVLGGDCSILIGIMAALKARGTYGLFFLDAHADFYEPEKSATGEAADMELALITGRGPDLLQTSERPYAIDEHIIHIGQRDMGETKKFGSRDIHASGIKCFDLPFIEKNGVDQTLQGVNDHLSSISNDGYWIHFDTDVLSDDINPAVDYRLPGGLSFEQCEKILTTLIHRYKIIGMSITIFNPTLDPDGKIASTLTEHIVKVFKE